jgi:hypothetical protein
MRGTNRATVDDPIPFLLNDSFFFGGARRLLYALKFSLQNCLSHSTNGY